MRDDEMKKKKNEDEQTQMREDVGKNQIKLAFTSLMKLCNHIIKKKIRRQWTDERNYNKNLLRNNSSIKRL